MPTLGAHLIGRLGNLMFIYAHARAYAERNGYELCLPEWIGEKIFDLPTPLRPSNTKIDLMLPEKTFQHQDDLIYRRCQVRQWFRIRKEIDAVLSRLVYDHEHVLNIRQAHDYSGSGFCCITHASYVAAHKRAGFEDRCVWTETDTNPTRLPDFAGSETAAGLGTSWVALPSFYRLMSARVLFRANSTFSWWAATLSHARVFSPVIKGLKGGRDVQCDTFVEGNWPVMCDVAQNSDLFLYE
jgi:hypothetical protein